MGTKIKIFRVVTNYLNGEFYEQGYFVYINAMRSEAIKMAALICANPINKRASFSMIPSFGDIGQKMEYKEILYKKSGTKDKLRNFDLSLVIPEKF